jgi:L-threonylcarbamoyladenylate synthase
MNSKSTLTPEAAVQRLRQGEVVALPSETVYGLAADIFNDEALKKVFAVKGRPFFDPLIVHVRSLEEARGLSREWTELHEFLARSFWPGPLTLIAPKAKRVSDLITSGLDTVALRYPAHPIFQEVLRLMGSPLAAPSANRFGKTSPTEASHVLTEFNGRVEVVDGGASNVGVESTVLLPAQASGGFRLEILRPGGITRERLAQILKNFSRPVEIFELEKQNSPGHLKHHYQPDKVLYVLEGLKNREEAFSILRSRGLRPENWRELILNSDPLIAARELYRDMRHLASLPGEALYVFRENHHHGELWTAIWDRLLRAGQAPLDKVPGT